jgi:hypothetical protein
LLKNRKQGKESFSQSRLLGSGSGLWWVMGAVGVGVGVSDEVG